MPDWVVLARRSANTGARFMSLANGIIANLFDTLVWLQLEKPRYRYRSTSDLSALQGLHVCVN